MWKGGVMMRVTRISMVLIAVSVCLSLQREALAQSRVAYGPSNHPPVAKLTATINPTFIDDIEFEGMTNVSVKDVTREFDNKRINVTKDAVLIFANVQEGAKIITQMLDDKGYLDVAVEVRLEDVGRRSKRLTYVVTEGRPFVVKEVQFQGNKVFSDAELRSRLTRVNESGREVFDRMKLDRDLNGICDYMHQVGYLEATIGEPKFQSTDDNVTIIVPVEEGRRFRIGEITIRGANHVLPEQIIEAVGMTRGDIADGCKLSDDVYEDLSSLYRNAGHPRYSTELDTDYRVNPTLASEGIVDVLITIDEGICFRIGSIEFNGNKNLTADVLRRFLLFKEGDTYNLQLIEDSVRGLSESGLVRPVELDADVDEQFDEETGLVNVNISVQELQDY
jgi:outer membrane protein insertion porin family